MKITAIDVYLLSLSLRNPLRFETVPFSANPCEWSRLETVLVRLCSDEAHGWGEACPGNGPFWSADWASATFFCLRDWLAPQLVGRELGTPEELHEHLAIFRGHRSAKAALDMAVWDLRSRAKNRTLYEELGATSRQLALGTSLDRPGYVTIDDFIRDVATAFELGYSRVTVKVRPGWDIQMLNIVRHEFPTQNIQGDFEGALTLNHLETLYRIDDFSLSLIEQPLPPDDLVGHAMVQEALRTPVCLDESITTPAQADMALELQSAKYLNVNPVRVGGLTPAKAIHDAAHHYCVPCYLGMYPGTTISARAGLALAALPNFCSPADFWDTAQNFVEDIAEPLETVKSQDTGNLIAALWSGPGLGVEPIPEVLQKYILVEFHLP
ncbi:MAG: enolase C-terminal domain-like protein [Thermogutta sp.]